MANEMTLKRIDPNALRKNLNGRGLPYVPQVVEAAIEDWDKASPYIKSITYPAIIYEFEETVAGDEGGKQIVTIEGLSMMYETTSKYRDYAMIDLGSFMREPTDD